MKISIHRWPPYSDQDHHGVLAIDDESGYAVTAISEPTRQANRNLAEKRLRKASVMRERIAELEQRQRSHLALIVKLTNETPFADEIAGWKEQRAKMIAEIGTLKAKISELEHKEKT
jgi:hypothetical protein